MLPCKTDQLYIGYQAQSNDNTDTKPFNIITFKRRKVVIIFFLINYSFNLMEITNCNERKLFALSTRSAALSQNHWQNLDTPSLLFLSTLLFLPALCPCLSDGSLHLIISFIVHFFHHLHYTCAGIRFHVFFFKTCTTGPADKHTDFINKSFTKHKNV